MIKPVAESSEFDLDKDGEVTDTEITKSNELMELELREEKADTQKFISYIALASIILVTAILVSPIVSDSRVDALGNLLSMFYLAQASIIGFYFGATAYMSK
jgi:hypothetical protein